MTSWIINYVIDKYLNHIIEVDSNITDASILKDGQIEFGNVKIKKEFLNSLNMPFLEFKETFIGKFTAQINFSLLRLDYHFENYPIYILLDEVFLLVKQKGMNNWTEEQKIKEIENFKNLRLQAFEDAYKQYLMNMAESTQQNDFIKKIIHNLNISISNIVLRFEDDISDASKPYSLGIVISNIVSKPTKSDYDVKSHEDVPYGEINHKVLILKGLSIFMDVKNQDEKDLNCYKKKIMKTELVDNLNKKPYLQDSYDFYCYCLSELNTLSNDQESHNYLMYNLGLTLNLNFNSSIKTNKKPFLFTDLNIYSINLKINILQIRTIIQLLNQINTFNITQTGLQSYIFSKKISDNEKQHYINIYIKYFEERYFKNSSEESWCKEQKELEEIQKGLSFDDIQAMRNSANVKLEYMKKLNDYEDKIAKLNPGFFSMFTSQSTKDEMKNLQEEKSRLVNSEDVIKKLMEEEMQKQNIVEKDPFDNMEDTYIKYDIKISFKNFIFELYEDINKELIAINLKDFESHSLIGVKIIQTYLYLGDFNINQYKLRETNFNKIIETHEDINEEIKSNLNLEEGNYIEKHYESKKGALAIGFEMSPDSFNQKNRIRIRNSKRLFIYINFYSLKYIGHLLSETFKSEVDFEEVKKHVTEEAYRQIRKGYEKANELLAGDYNYFGFEADILLQGPKIFMPQNIIDRFNKKCLMLSFGEIHFKSNLAPEKEDNIDYKKITDDDKLYDNYELKINGFELQTIDKFKGSHELLNTQKLNIMDKLDFEIIFSQIIVPKNESRENFRIGMEFKFINLKIRDTQIEFVIYFIKYFNELNEKLDKEIKQLNKGKEQKESSLERNPDELNKFSEQDHNKSFSENPKNENDVQKRDEPDRDYSNAKAILDKFFLKFQFNIQKIEISLFKSLETEERELLESNNIISEDKENKQFINFILNSFCFNLSLKENLFVEFNMRIFNIFLIDKEFKWKLNSERNIVEFPILNQEFSVLFGTLNYETDKDLSQSRSMRIKSQVEEKMNEISKKLGKIPNFLDLAIKQNTPNKKTNVKVSLTKFVINFNFSTYRRVIEYFNLIQKYQKRLLATKKPAYRKSQTLKDKLKFIESKKDEYIRSGIRKNFMPKLLDKIRERKRKIQNVLKGQPIKNPRKEDKILLKDKNLDKMSLGEKSVSSRRNSIMHEKSYLYIQKFIKQKIKVNFDMKQIELNIPLNAENEGTRAIVFDLNAMFKFKYLLESENYYDKSNNKLVMQNYLKKNSWLNIMIYNIDFDMYNLANSQIIFNLLNEKILSNSRMKISFKKFLVIDKKTDVVKIDVKVEPITMILGFRQVRILKDLVEIITEKIKPKKEKDNINSYFHENKIENPQEASYQRSSRSVDVKTFGIENDKLNFSHDNMFDLSNPSTSNKAIDFKNYEYEEKLNKKINKIQNKIENQIKYNTALFNQLVDINFILEKAIFKLVDNTGDYEKPLTKLEVSKISSKVITNSHPYDIENMSQAIIEMLCDRKPDNLNICNLYTFMDSYFTVDVKFYNERVSDWEPILEPWSANFRIEQIDKITRKKLEFRSDLIINFNFSAHSIEVLNLIMKKIHQNEADWKKDEPKKNLEAIEECDLIGDNRISTSIKNKENVSLIFENRSGLDISFYFLADETNKFGLANGYQKMFNKNDLTSIYKNLDDNIRIRKKDKFGFKFADIPLYIDDIDFSFNHFVIKKIIIPKTNLNNSDSNIRSFNLENDYFMNMREGNLNEKLLKSEEKKERIVNNQNEMNLEVKADAPISNRELDISKSIEVCIKIKNNGLVRVISIESNISILNNTNFPTKLYFFNKKSNKSKELLINGKIELAKSAGSLKCVPYSFVQIPLNYILETHLIYVGLKVDNNVEEFYSLIFSDFNTIYSIGDEYNKKLYDGYLDNADEKKNFLKSIAKEKSQQMKFESKSKINIINGDILILKSKDTLATSYLEEDSDEMKDKWELFYYQILLNPPVTIENKAPFDLNVVYRYDKNLIKDGKNIEETSEKYSNNYSIFPLDKHKIYDFDLNKGLVDLMFTLNYQYQFKYTSKVHNCKSFSEENKNYLNLIRNMNEKDSFEMIVEVKKLSTNKFFDFNYLDVEFYLSTSKIFVCYFDYIIVNRLSEDILIKPNNLNSSKEEILIHKDLACYNLQAKALNLFSSPRNNSRASIKIGNSDWSNDFDLSAHGIESGNSVLISNPNDPTYITNHEFATLVTGSRIYNFSTILIVEPRHVMVNKTGLDLKFRQVLDDKNISSKETQIIFNETEKTIKLNKYPNYDNKKNIQFFLHKGFFNNEDRSDDLWSQIINVDNLQEYNIAIFIPNYFDFKSYSKLDPYDKNIYQYDENNKFFLLRVILQSLDSGLVYIILTQPNFPQFMVKNSSKEFVSIKQTRTEQLIKISPGQTVPYTLKDLTISDPGKEVELEIFGRKTTINLDNFEGPNEIILDKEKEIKSSNYYSNYKIDNSQLLNIDILEKDNERSEFINSLEEAKVFFSVSTENKSITRVINVYTNFDDEEGLMETKENIFSKTIKSKVINFKLKIKGLGISLIDSFPREIFYLSLYGLKVFLRNYVSKNGYIINKFANFVVYLKNFQIDYCLGGSFRQIITPKNQFIPSNEKEIDRRHYVEFMKLLITKAYSFNLSNDSENEKIAQVEFLLQEFNVKIDQQIVNVLLNYLGQLLTRIDFYKEEMTNVMEEEKFDVEDEGNILEKGFKIKEITEKNVNIMRTSLETEDIKIIKKRSSLKSKDENFGDEENLNTDTGNLKTKSSLSNEDVKRISAKFRLRSASALEKFSPEPNTAVNYPNYEEVLKLSDESGFYNITKLIISAIRINLSLRLDLTSIELSNVPTFVTSILGTIGNAITRISDSPIAFNEMRITNIYTNIGYILAFILNQYKNQGILQIYKLIGSSDLIGNPVGLVGKIGTGVVELFDEPRKGFENGPIYFGTGLAKGVNSLVSNVIGGSFDVVGKITGTLYNATRNIKGERPKIIDEEEPSNIISGAVYGVSGGVEEIGKGISGIFIDPYKSAKREGVKGFFKGVGSGLIGASISPLSAVFRVSNSLAVGMRNTATFFSKSKIKTDRFRHPRFINTTEALKPYDKDLAESQAILGNVYKSYYQTGSYYRVFPKIIYTQDFIYADVEYNDKPSTIIITDYNLVVVFDGTLKICEVFLRNIKKTEVHKTLEDGFVLVVFLKDERQKFIPCNSLDLLCTVHVIVERLI